MLNKFIFNFQIKFHMPDTNVLTPTPTPQPIVDSAKSNAETQDKEKIAIDALHNVLSEVMSALKKIGEDVDNINKRVSVLEKSISIPLSGEKITVEGKKNGDGEKKVGDYKTDAVEFVKSTKNVPTATANATLSVNPEVTIIKSILTADKELSAKDVYYIVRKNLSANKVVI
jgi:Mg2+ and Co2+ transporter CorA